MIIVNTPSYCLLTFKFFFQINSHKEILTAFTTIIFSLRWGIHNLLITIFEISVKNVVISNKVQLI